MAHITVLLKESIDGLDIKVGEVFVDGTLGSGGHTEEVAKRFGKSVKIVALDADSDAIERSKKRLAEVESDISFVETNFRNVDKALESLKIEKIDKALFDLGFSSNQLEESGRGFSFQKDEPLLMTFSKNPKEGELTAYEIINSWSVEGITQILRDYGEERFARKIAEKIVESRRIRSIGTTGELVSVVVSAVPKFYQNGKINPATRTFQALRIATNDEFKSIEEGITRIFQKLNSGGRIAVISFHSGEDRIIKNLFRDWKKEGVAELINKKPITPTDDEIENNPRARSSKLRIIKKL